MRRLFIAAMLGLLSAPASAQGTLKQSTTPDNGVGVDYTKPYVNDLMRRGDPLTSRRVSETIGHAISESRRQFCETQFEAFKKDPASDALRETSTACRKKFREEVQPLVVKAFQRQLPGVQAQPYRAQPSPPSGTRRLPLSPSHPNAQN